MTAMAAMAIILMVTPVEGSTVALFAVSYGGGIGGIGGIGGTWSRRRGRERQ